MVDETRVLRLLRAVTDDVTVLRTEAGAAPDRRADPLWLRGVKYTFVTALEACVDVAQHLCASAAWGPPSDNGDAIALLGRHEVLGPTLAEAMRRAVGFRDVLVHEHVTVSDAIALARLHDPTDPEQFAAEVAAFVTGSAGDN